MEIKWDSSMSMGEKTIDEQHKKLLKQLNKLIKMLSSGVDIGPMRETLGFLKKYSDEHFSYEEEYQARNNFPGLKEHKKMHAEFIEFYNKFKQDFETVYKTGKISSFQIETLLKEAKKFLAEWYLHHILVEDRKYATYITEHR